MKLFFNFIPYDFLYKIWFSFFSNLYFFYPPFYPPLSYLVILEDVLFRIHTYDRSDKLKSIYILFFSIFFWICHSTLSFAGNRYSYFLFLSMQLSHSNLIFTLLINKIIKIFLEYCKDMFS